MPSKIIVVGLGPGDPKKMTIEAWDILRRARKVYVRTLHHPTVRGLPEGLEVESFDWAYEQASSFDAAYSSIASRLMALAGEPGSGDVVYAVPGDPMVGEASVQLLQTAASEAGVEVAIVSGMSFLEPALAAVGVDPLAGGLQLADALAFDTDGEAGGSGRSLMRLRPPLDPTIPAVVSQLYSREVASSVKLALLEVYPADHQVLMVRGAGLQSQRVTRLPLHDIDRAGSAVDHLTLLYLPPIGLEEALTLFRALEWIIARLRSPEGCPWDREQTHQSLKPHLIEETYEVVEALDAGDPAKLAEELGDLLLQIVLHAEIAGEAGDFDMGDVIEGIAQKLIRRHPHVFAGLEVSGSGEVLRNWEEIKRQERRDAGEEDEHTGGKGRSMLSGVPRAMPALSYAQEIQDRARRVGFDWENIEGVLEKLTEELDELRQARTKAERREELGDLLFSAVNLARWLGVNAEEALRATNAKFRRRFEAVEVAAEAEGRTLSELSLQELDRLWEAAKHLEQGSVDRQ